MATLMRFPDVQRVLVLDLETLAGANHTGIQTPTNLAQVLPFVRVLRTGGPSDLLNDYPRVDVDVFAATYEAAELLAEQIRQRIVGPPPAIGVFDRARCDIGPRELEWGDGTGVRRFHAAYSMTTRRRRFDIA